MKTGTDGNLLVGIGYGLMFSIPLWVGMIWAASVAIRALAL